MISDKALLLSTIVVNDKAIHFLRYSSYFIEKTYKMYNNQHYQDEKKYMILEVYNYS